MACGTSVTLSGTKQANTAIWMNEEEVVPIDESPTFSVQAPLTQGLNVLIFTAHSATGQLSEAVQIDIQAQSLVPEAPTAELVPPIVEASTYELKGAKPPGTRLVLNGAELLALGPETTWATNIDLQPGDNKFLLAAANECAESPVLEVNIYSDPEGIDITVEDPDPVSCLDAIILQGARGAGVAVYINDQEVLGAETSSNAWSYEYTLEDGDNQIVVHGIQGTRRGASREFIVAADTSIPGPPTVSGSPQVTTLTSLSVAGTKMSGAILIVDDIEKAEFTSQTDFSITLELQAGTNIHTFDQSTRCGRVSGTPAVVAVVLDQEAPEVDLVFPEPDFAASEAFDLSARATDNDEVARVTVLLDMMPLVSSGLEIVSAPVDVSALTNGQHTLQIQATDRAGNTSMPVTTIFTKLGGIVVVSQEPATLDALSAVSSRPTVSATVSGVAYAVWYDNNPALGGGSDDDVFIRDIPSNGAPVLVSDQLGGGSSRNPTVACQSAGIAHVVWQDDGSMDGDVRIDEDILYRRYDGPTPAIVELISGGTSTGRSRFADIAVDHSGEVHVVWQDDGDLDGDGLAEADIYYSSSTGSGFSAPVLLSSDAGDGISARPRIAVTPDYQLHVVWQETGIDADNLSDIYYRSRDELGVWQTSQLVSEEPGFGPVRNPSISADPNDPFNIVYVAFDAPGDVANSGTDSDVFLRLVFDGTMGAAILVSDAPGDGASADPSITVDAWGSVHVAFWDTGDIMGGGSDPDVFLRTFDGTLGPLRLISEGGSGTSLFPSIGASDNTLHIIWQDDADHDGDGVSDFDIVSSTRGQ